MQLDIEIYLSRTPKRQMPLLLERDSPFRLWTLGGLEGNMLAVTLPAIYSPFLLNEVYPIVESDRVYKAAQRALRFKARSVLTYSDWNMDPASLQSWKTIMDYFPSKNIPFFMLAVDRTRWMTHDERRLVCGVNPHRGIRVMDQELLVNIADKIE